MTAAAHRSDGDVEPPPDANRVRRAAFDALRTGTAARLGDIAGRTGVGVQHVRGIVGQLVTAGIATIDGDVDGDPMAIGAEGLTVRATAHQLVLGGRLLHACCAIDRRHPGRPVPQPDADVLLCLITTDRAATAVAALPGRLGPTGAATAAGALLILGERNPRSDRDAPAQ